MSVDDEVGSCPHCGFRDVPTLIVGSSVVVGGGTSWRCHSCHQTWTDREYLQLQAS
jgi:transposase-like protein